MNFTDVHRIQSSQQDKLGRIDPDSLNWRKKRGYFRPAPRMQRIAVAGAKGPRTGAAQARVVRDPAAR
jgi:hypothetical protein